MTTEKNIYTNHLIDINSVVTLKYNEDICIICNDTYIKNSFNCVECKNLNACINCINNFSSRNFKIDPKYIDTIKDKIIEYNDINTHQLVFDCCICRHTNSLNFRDMTKSEIIQFSFIDYLKQYHANKKTLEYKDALENSIYSIVQIENGFYTSDNIYKKMKTLEDENNKLKTYYDKYDDIRLINIALKKENDILLKENTRLKRENAETVNEQLERDNIFLSNQLKTVNNELYESKKEGLIHYSCLDAFSRVSEKHLTSIKELFYNTAGKNTKAFYKKMNALLQTTYDVKINILNGEPTVKIKPIKKMI